MLVSAESLDAAAMLYCASGIQPGRHNILIEHCCDVLAAH
jgi:hypothetical protein